jgi:hypothetical protein
MPHRKPYDPGTQGPQVHDRRARQVNRGTVGYIVEVEIEDPYDTTARISAVRSVRDDPLADHLARGHIDQAQYLAGREFQKYFGIAERGPQAMQMTEAVDGGLPAETLTSERLKAGKWLAKCYGALGKDGSVLMHDMLVQNMTTTQIALARGMIGQDWHRYFAKRLYECLNTLALVYGFSNGTNP